MNDGEQMLDGARQVVRWSIPGGLFVMFTGAQLFVLMTLSVLVDPPRSLGVARLPMFSLSRMRISADHVLGLWLAQASPGVAGIIIAVVIPLGFLIYQVYYYVTEGYTRIGFKAASDRGADILQGLFDLDGHNRYLVGRTLGIDADEVLIRTSDFKGGRWWQRLRWVVVPTRLEPSEKLDPAVWKASNHAVNRARTPHEKPKRQVDVQWRYARSCSYNLHVVLVLVALVPDEVGKNLLTTTRNLTDIYHGLGAARFSVTAAFVLALVSDLLVLGDRDRIIGLSWAAVCAVSFALLWSVLFTNRRDSGIRLVNETVTMLHVYLHSHGGGLVSVSPDIVIRMPPQDQGGGHPAETSRARRTAGRRDEPSRSGDETPD